MCRIGGRYAAADAATADAAAAAAATADDAAAVADAYQTIGRRVMQCSRSGSRMMRNGCCCRANVQWMRCTGTAAAGAVRLMVMVMR